ncbi:homoserine dehydrogenase [Glycocaulis profundi]|nr:homoserine dehydrogenase [Glycocaulis profundi]
MKPDDQAPEAEEDKPKLCVLKFGSSVLGGLGDYAAVAQEVFRHVREGEQVVAVVSALAGETDNLLAEAEAVGGEAAPALAARLVRTGEFRSAALMALALSRIGVRACALDPHEMGLFAQGPAMDSDLCELDARAVKAKLAAHEVLVVPGFTACHAEHGAVTLGRGGTDLSAVFFAEKLGAERVRLIKDVDGVYAEDPADNPRAERFAELDYDRAAAASKGLIQPKAIEAAKAADVVIEVAAMGAGHCTRVARAPARLDAPRPQRPLRVALLGCGAVGAGVLAHLKSRPDLFELNPVLVRDPEKHAGKPGVTFTSRPDRALSGRPELVIELMGGPDYPATVMEAALQAGASVATANKAALARHHAALHAAARAGGAHVAYSAAVGGGTPILETVERLKSGPGVVAVEGVMNGTANFLLDRLKEGWAFDDAVKKAQELGFAEADPAADVDGHDAADKVSLLVKEAFGVSLSPREVAKDSLRDVSPERSKKAAAEGKALKQVGRLELKPDGSVEASVRILALPLDHPLAGARNEENRFVVRDGAGRVHALFGKGAGRWPTAAAVFADVMDIQRKLCGADSLKLQGAAPARRLSA